ncbi:hypothetical protein ACKKBG_A38240 [Auxenochlorella protothecoides x Auxenochlorella symbiontica]
MAQQRGVLAALWAATLMLLLATVPQVAGRAAGNCYKNWDFWGFNSEPAAYGPIPICTGGTVTFRWHSVQGVYQIPGPGICPPPSGTSSASSTCSLLPSTQPPAAVAPCEELAPLQQGTHSPTGMYIWADPGAGGGVTYWFTSQAGTACEDGMILQVQTVDISV